MKIIKNLYIPVLKTREGEYEIIRTYKFGSKTIPMIMCMEEYQDGSTLNNFKDFYSDLLKNQTKVIVDFPCRVGYKADFPAHLKNFTYTLRNNPESRLDYLSSLSKCDNVIPCISFHQKIFSSPKKLVSTALKKLDEYDQFAYSIHCNGNKIDDNKSYVRACIKAINSNATTDDIIIFNIDGRKHDKGLGADLIKDIEKRLHPDLVKRFVIFAFSPKKNDKINVPHGSYLANPDTEKYLNYSFHNKCKTGELFGVSDMAGLDDTKPSIATQYRNPVPKLLMSDLDRYDMWGYFGTDTKKIHYENTLWIDYLNSHHWKVNITNGHVSNCPGCKLIESMKKGTIPTRSAYWRKIMILHHLYEMDIFL